MSIPTTPDVKITPLMPKRIPQNKLFVSPESSWYPDSDGKWQLHPFAFDRWDVEEMAYHDTCSLHIGLNPFNVFKVHGSDYLKMLTCATVNTFNKFPVGKARHVIFCDDGGKILLDGILIRTGEEDFLGFNLVDPNFLNMQMGNPFQIECKNLREEYFVFQLCGKRSLEIVEQVCRKDLHDLKFMYSTQAEIDGKEVECAILDGKEVTASTVGEIMSAEDFYSFDAKYNIPESKTVIPAEITEEQIEEIRKLAVRAFKAIDGKGLSRVDFFVENGTDKIYINEINTMPGFTKISMYPKLFEAVGVSYSELLDKLIQNAMK